MPWTSIKELEQISLRLEDDNAGDDPEYLKWLNILIIPGSSLGGARPKASVLDDKKNLWIAKFPSRSDIKDIGGWEKVTNELAGNAGLNVAVSKIRAGTYGQSFRKVFIGLLSCCKVQLLLKNDYILQFL